MGRSQAAPGYLVPDAQQLADASYDSTDASVSSAFWDIFDAGGQASAPATCILVNIVLPVTTVPVVKVRVCKS